MQEKLGTVVGLGFSRNSLVDASRDQQQLMNAVSLFIERLQQACHELVPPGKLFGVVGEGPLIDFVQSWLRQSPLAARFAGRFDLSPHPRRTEGFRDPLELGLSSEVSILLSIDLEENWIPCFRSLRYGFGYKDTIVFPFLPEGTDLVRACDGRPVTLVTVPACGSGRFKPAFTKLLGYAGFQNVNHIDSEPPLRVRSFLDTHRHSILSNIKETAICEEWAHGRMSTLGHHEWIEFHWPIRIDRLLQNTNSRLVYLARDPRDQLMSLYFFYRQELMEKGSRLADLRCPVAELFLDDHRKEDACVALLSGEFMRAAYHEILYWPRLDFTLDNILAARAAPRASVVTFESLISDPEPAYRKLLGELDLERSEFGEVDSPAYQAAIEAGLPESIKRKPESEAVGGVIYNRKEGQWVRNGTAGDWRNHFTPRLISVAKSIFGEKLQEAGYSW